MNDHDDDFDVCKCTVIHTDVVDRVRRQMQGDDTIYNLSQFFKVFGDPTRLKIIQSLSLAELCVCDISALLDLNQSTVSHQLKILKLNRLVKIRRDGKVVYYSLDDEHINQILSQGLSHIKEE